MNQHVVVVTGGGRGIGRAACRRFAAAGAVCVAASRNVEELAETKRLIESEGGQCHVQPTDVVKAEDAQTLIDVAADKFGRIDVIVNAAGVAPMVPVEELDAKVFDTILAVNVRGIFNVCRAAWPVLKRQGGGVFINVSSIAATSPFPGLEAYGASKAWVNAWTSSIAASGRPLGIRAYAIGPGAVNTRMLRDIFPDYPEDQMLSPEEVADTIFTLADEPLRFATGQVVYIRKGE